MIDKVFALICNSDHTKFLAIRRSATDAQFPNMLGIPGGGVEPGETAIDAVDREVWEETGVRTTSIQTEPIYDNSITIRGQEFRTRVYTATIASENFLPQPGEADAVLWVDSRAYLQNLVEHNYPQDQIILFTDLLVQRGLHS